MAADPQQIVAALRGAKPNPPQTDAKTVVQQLSKKSEKKDGGKRTITLIRHGATKLNNDDVSVDRIRGWKDIPLSKDGEDEAHKLGKSLKNNPPDVIVTSDLKRAADTAKIVGEHTGAPVVDETEGFRPWNVGELAGEISSKAIPVLANYATKKPDETIPGGESFNNFKDRFFNALHTTLADHPGKKVAIVTHHRGERLVKSWLAAGAPQDGQIDKGVFNQKGEPTGNAEEIDLPVHKADAVIKQG